MISDFGLPIEQGNYKGLIYPLCYTRKISTSKS